MGGEESIGGRSGRGKEGTEIGREESSSPHGFGYLGFPCVLRFRSPLFSLLFFDGTLVLDNK